MSSSRKYRKDIVLSLYKDVRTVFRLIDVAMLTEETCMKTLSKKLNYYVGKGQLQNPRKGIYTKPGYKPEELACRIYTPSYISLEYVLQKAGIIFQFDRRITVVSYLSRNIEVDKQSISYRKIKGELLVNTSGMRKILPHVNMAGTERAFLDMLYLNPNFYFDNLNPLNKKLLIKLLSVYQSKALSQRVNKILFDA